MVFQFITRKKLLFYIFSLIIILAGILIFYKYKDRAEARICFEENCFKAELVKTEAEKAQGLMFRESLSSDRGMLFIFHPKGI